MRRRAVRRVNDPHAIDRNNVPPLLSGNGIVRMPAASSRNLEMKVEIAFKSDSNHCQWPKLNRAQDER